MLYVKCKQWLLISLINVSASEHINTHIDMHTLAHTQTHTHIHAYCSKTPDERPPHEVGMELVQLSARSGALPMQFWATAQCSNGFSPRACFQCRPSYNIHTAQGALACSNNSMHTKKTALVAIPLFGHMKTSTHCVHPCRGLKMHLSPKKQVY